MSQTQAEIEDLLKNGDKYELQSEATSQGMNSYAFVALHKPLKLRVFLKVYDLNPDSTELFQEAQFLQEVTGENAVGSESLVRVLDAQLLGTDYGVIAMEYLKGGDLYSRLKAGPFAQQDAVGAAIALLNGVACLHTQGLVHRDIKPGNIILSAQGGRQVLKLGDFGSVARLDSDTGSVTASKHSALYVPPEGCGLDPAWWTPFEASRGCPWNRSRRSRSGRGGASPMSSGQVRSAWWWRRGRPWRRWPGTST